ncbi:MAG: hypothetical protein AAB265_14115, partial [candidate division NC10 bacterium]
STASASGELSSRSSTCSRARRSRSLPIPRAFSTYVFDETVTLTQARLGHRRAVAVGRTLLDPAIVDLLRVTPVDERTAWALFERRPDKS